MNNLIPLREIAAANLSALMAADKNLNTLDRVAAKAKCGRGTVERMKKGQVAVTLDTLEGVAKAFKLQPWQMLVSGLSPTNPPALGPQSETERALYKRLLSLAQEFAVKK